MTERQTTGRRLIVRLVVAVAVTLATLVGIGQLIPLDLTIGSLTVRSQRGATVDISRDAAPTVAPLLPPPDQQPGVGLDVRNVVLFIGDGMGVGTTSLASLALHGARGGLAFEHAPVVGLVRTGCADRPVTDSAAAGTALATGFKADYHTVSRLTDGRVPVTLFEAAAAQGWRIGAITTTGLTDATPATFTSHAASRYDFRSILEQMLASRFDVLIGGDHRLYRKAMRAEGYQQALADAESLAAPGVQVIRRDEDLDSATTPMVALLPPRPDGRGGYGPPLATTTALALELLADDDRGFLLLVESELTDEMGHDNDADALIDAVAELDEAVTAALEFAALRDDTLVLVTADHDTGSPGLVSSSSRYGEPAPVRWTTSEHTSQWVPLYAFGPGASRFGGVLDNTHIPLQLASLLGLTDFPGTH
jgi:alkaline phosphatase